MEPNGETRRIALIVDNPDRDLPGLVLVAMRLCASGATCYLVPFNRRVRELWALAPDFVLMNYLRVKNEALIRQLEEAGIQVGVLDTEALLQPAFDLYAQTLTKDEEVRRQIACFCSWGPRFAEHAVSAGWYTQRQVAVTGSPRMDFYAPPWREAAKRANTSSEGYGRDLILVNGAFPIANPGFATPQEEARSLILYYGYDSARVAAMQQAQQQGLEGLAVVANNLARHLPQATVVYRPHPFERLETYKGLLEERPNLHLVREGTVDGWILRARAVVQRGCFTAIEASLAGVPTLSPLWIPIASPQPAAEAVSIPCLTEADLVAAVEDILAGQWRAPTGLTAHLSETVGDWFFRNDGRAHERVAEAIEQRVNGHRGTVRIARCLDMLYGLDGSAMPARRRVGARLRRHLRLPADWAFTRWRVVINNGWDRSEKAFWASDVRRIAEAIAEASGSNGGPLGPVEIAQAAHGVDYIAPQDGRSVTIRPSGRP